MTTANEDLERLQSMLRCREAAVYWDKEQERDISTLQYAISTVTENARLREALKTISDKAYCPQLPLSGNVFMPNGEGGSEEISHWIKRVLQ